MPEDIQIPNLTDSQRLYQAMIENLVRMNTSLTTVIDTQKTHHKILLEGEGDDLPLLERVRNLEAFQKWFQFWFRTIAVALVLQTITFGVAAIAYFVKLYPLLDALSKKP